MLENVVWKPCGSLSSFADGTFERIERLKCKQEKLFGQFQMSANSATVKAGITATDVYNLVKHGYPTHSRQDRWTTANSLTLL